MPTLVAAAIGGLEDLEAVPTTLSLGAQKVDLRELRQFLYPHIEFLDRSVALELRASGPFDRLLVERSPLPSLFDSRDSIMCDKGFDVQDIFAPFNVTINIPTFMRKKNELSNKEVLKDRKIASKRVHVERIIGYAKTYKILTSPMNDIETILGSQIVFSCFMLCHIRAFTFLCVNVYRGVFVYVFMGANYSV